MGAHSPDRLQLLPRILIDKIGRNRAAVDADPNRNAVLARHVGQPSHLLRDGLRLLDMVEMAGVVTDLVDVWRDFAGDLVVFLQVDRQHYAPGLGADFLQRGSLFLIDDRDPDDTGAGASQLMGLRDGQVDIDRARGAHRLHHHRRAAADLDAADIYLSAPWILVSLGHSN